MLHFCSREGWVFCLFTEVGVGDMTLKCVISGLSTLSLKFSGNCHSIKQLVRGELGHSCHTSSPLPLSSQLEQEGEKSGAQP